ncbi:MAG TPA: hypothetical protein VN653_13110 [Anaerolineales bacterium]|nr:hypothetical protein [Anaerolineales bacterium]
MTIGNAKLKALAEAATPGLREKDGGQALMMELAELSRDAERYRFIRSNRANVQFLSSSDKGKKWIQEYLLSGSRMDNAIDSAMRIAERNDG